MFVILLSIITSISLKYEWSECRGWKYEMLFTWNERYNREIVGTCKMYLQKWLFRRTTIMLGTHFASQLIGAKS